MRTGGGKGGGGKVLARFVRDSVQQLDGREEGGLARGSTAVGGRRGSRGDCGDWIWRSGV